MGKIAIVYWSGTGNTEAMANFVAEGAGGQADLFTPGEFSADLISSYSALAFGCPSMGAEQLEEAEFEPMFEAVKPRLSGKTIGLFGSYGWGDGEWMRTWAEDCESAGCNLVSEPVICNEAPDDAAAESCRALGGALAMRYMPANTSAFVMIVVVLLCAALLGTVYSSLLAVACINFKADQTIVGTALNMLGTAGATVIVKAINTAANPDDVSSIVQYAGAKKAFTVNLGSFEFSWFMLVTALLLAASYVLLYKTRFGLRLMACGEHPQAADSVGINVYKMRWAGVLISGFLGGIGGIVFITAGVSEWRFEYGVAGFGFLSLAVMIFGQWKPQRIALAALLFGLFRALSNVYMGFGFLTAMNIPSPVYNMMPYIISLIVLAFTSKRSRAPKAEGIPYDKGQR